jgi:siroheme decarboxylase
MSAVMSEGGEGGEVSGVNSADEANELDRRLIVATQAGLPLVAQPYHALAEQLGVSPQVVMARMQAMLERGKIRRIGAVPNHYAIGYTANGMSVWDVPDELIDTLGEQVGALDFVTHCYHRPRALPAWPYNLFAMVHGSSREEVLTKVAEIHALLGAACRSHDVLFSTRILKKTGLRIAG